MRKVILGAAISLDGYIARANGAVDFLMMSEGVSKALAEFFSSIDALVMGRKTAPATVALPAFQSNCRRMSSRGLNRLASGMASTTISFSLKTTVSRWECAASSTNGCAPRLSVSERLGLGRSGTCPTVF
jgi:dihydrofolate reductase